MRNRSLLTAAGLGLTLVVARGAAEASYNDGGYAQLQALDKITARISTLAAPIDTPIKFGTLEIIVRRCVFRPPEETPENVAFLEVADRGHDKTKPGKLVFSGWVFSSSPAVSALEHPVYDITLLSCLAD
jgi:hypothetical protein